MMNNPFFRRNRQPSYTARPIPVQKTEQKSSPKVISVPVQFISSDQSQTKPLISNNSAAITIQKVFRSFLVRKSVKNIISIKTEVAQIERKISDIQTVNLIRNDPKERLRVNETLMSLLFKLDSIRGIDSGVRDLRKTVTKKAIALQEKVDSIAQSNETESETVKEVVENCDSVSTDSHQVTETVVDDEVVEKCDSVKLVEGSKVLEKLMDDNEKMMKLMMQICERNEMQTRMINSLSRRVEYLEKGFMNDNKLRKKKKTNRGLRRRDRDDFYF